MVRRSHQFRPPEAASPLDTANDAASDVGSDILTVSDIHTITNEQEIAMMQRHGQLLLPPTGMTGMNGAYDGDEIRTIDPKEDNASIISDLQNTIGTGGAPDDIVSARGLPTQNRSDPPRANYKDDPATPIKSNTAPTSDTFWSRTRRSLGLSTAPSATPLTAQKTAEDEEGEEYYDEGRPIPPPAVIVTSQHSSTMEGDSTAAAASVWKQRLCGIRADRLIILLILVLMAAIAVIVGAVVASQTSSSDDGSSSSNASSAENDRPDKDFVTLTRTPTAFQAAPVAAPSPTVAAPVVLAPTPDTLCENNITLVDDARVVFPVENDDDNTNVEYRDCTWVADRPEQQDELCQPDQIPYELCRLTCKNCDELPMGQKLPWPTELCGGDSATASFNAGENLGMGNCNWLSKSSFDMARLCQPDASDAYHLCRETCRNCGPVVNVTTPTTLSPTGTPVTDAPSGVPVRSSPPPTALASSFPSAVPTPVLSRSTEAPVTAPVTAPPSARGLEEILRAASPSSADALSTFGSPQARAMEWLQIAWDNDSSLGDVSNERLVQLWSLATFAFSTGYDFSWLMNGGGDECFWDGVSCDFNTGVVSAIELANRNLEGTVPGELSLLSSLSSLILTSNSLTGPIPSLFGNFQQLQEFRIGRNNLSGTIPSEMGDMADLRIWYMERNSDIWGTIPSSLAQLTDLEEWVFYGTDIVDEFPQEVCALPNLVTLELNCRKITDSCYTRCLLECGGSTGIECRR